MIARAAAIRRARSAGASGFSGLPGLTSHQTRSSPKAFSAQLRDMHVPGMRRVERPAEQPDALAGALA